MVGSLPYNEKEGCPTGYHKKISYTSKQSRCVKDYSSRRTRKQNSYHALKNTSENEHKFRTAKLKCPPGKIPRHGYVRRFGSNVMRRGYTVKKASGKQYHIIPDKKTVYVKPACVKDKDYRNINAFGPGNRIGPLRKGELKKHGYVYLDNREERHNALKNAIKDYGPLGVFRKLDIVSKLSKYSAPEASRVFKEDRDWLKSHYELYK
jgi:hypothetical protein